MILAEVRDYWGLIGAIRQRIQDLAVTTESVDAVAGLPDRYTAKLIKPHNAIRGLGTISLGPLLGAIGLKLIVATDDNTATNTAKLTRSKFPNRGKRKPNNSPSTTQLKSKAAVFSS